MLAGHTLLLIATLLLLKTCHAVTTTSIDWHPLGDTDTGNEACAQDIGYQMISMSENGHANMVSGGRSVDYCEAQMPDVFKYGCTVGFVGFRTVDGGGAALILKAYYELFEGESKDLLLFYTAGNDQRVLNSERNEQFCERFCKAFKSAAKNDEYRMIQAQSYGHAVLYSLPTRQISAALNLKLPLAIAAVYAGVVNSGYNVLPGENVQIDLTDTRGHTIEGIIAASGISPAQGESEITWLRNFLHARSAALSSNPSFATTVTARIDAYLGLLLNGTSASVSGGHQQNLYLTPPVITNDAYGFPQNYSCFNSGLPVKILQTSRATPSKQKKSLLPAKWAGVNSKYLHAYSRADQLEIISHLKEAGIKVVRIFVSSAPSSVKGIQITSLKDVEQSKLISSDDRGRKDAILRAIDELMPTLMANGMQLIICLHDRYELDDDAYYDKYIKRGGLQAFYNHPQAQAVFDWRLAYIVSHVNPSMGNRTWYQIPEAIYAFEIQNEAQADSSVTSLMPAQRNPRWWCDRATSLRGVIGFNSPILISTGGGKGFSDSIVDENFECPAIDVIALHSYDSDITVYRPAIDLAVKKAKLNEKIVILEEFGAVGKAETKADWISRVSTIAREAGINWLPWEVSKPGGGSDFDFYVNDTAAWHALSNAASTLPADETELKKRDDGNPWAGVSSFFLYAYSIDDQAEILGNLQSAGVTKIRIFLTSIGAGSKNSNCNEVNDLESNDVGDYDDTILTMIDQLLQTMASGNYGIKLLICMHDRYQLDDSWGCDGYCTKFIQSMDVRSLDGFYKNSDAIAAYDARLQHIVNFTSSFIDDSGQNKTFGQLSDLIYAFEIQNEGQADGNGDQTPNGLHYSVDDGDRNWWCDRATTLKISEVWHTDSGIKISTGGGKDFYSSDLSENFNCGALDIVALHSYDDASQFGDTLSSIKQKADSNSKEIIFEEFGATGSPDSKAGLINQGSSAAQNAGISWLSWQVSKPGGNEGDYDYYINDESAWSALTSAASGSPQRRDAPTVSMIARDNAFSPPAWAGVNSYFLYSYPANEQISMFQTLQQANITVVRVFITSISAGTKGADNIQVHDLEESGVGTWNDKILMLVDDMMKRAEPFGIKFIICMHDRYMLDQTWGGCDGYCSLYVQPAGSLDGFYKNATAIQSFDARLQHIVSHTSSNFAGKAWAQLSNVIYAFEIQHEGQGTGLPNGFDYSVDAGDRNWWCDRARTLKASSAYHGGSIYVSTGGGKSLYESNLSEHFSCDALDVVALHSNNTDISEVKSNLVSVVNSAQSASTNKIVILEVFGTSGTNKAQWIQDVTEVAASVSCQLAYNISWLPWEVVKPGNSGGYEFWEGDDAFGALKTAALRLKDTFPRVWGGVNSYFLYAYPPDSQTDIFSALQGAHVKVVRIFLTSIGGYAKGTPNVQVDDLEANGIGAWNDDILTRVDDMMKRAEPYGIKFIICMHDRYMLDSTWGSCDGYCSQYVQPAGTLDGFYRNKDAINAYDQRLQHIVSHQSVNYTGKTWAQLSNVIFAFEIQNEGQASGAPNGYDYSVDVGDRNWWCGRATALKASAAYQGSSIYVSTGGGKDFYESILDEHFACGALDVIALHSYSTDINDVTNNLESAVQKATTKYVLFEEYGTNVGSDKAQWFQSVAQTAATLSAKYVNPISWMPWEAVNPGNPNDYEFWDDDAFIAVATAAKSLNP